MRMNLLLVSFPFLSIMPAIKGWNTAEMIFANASNIPTSVFEKPLAKRNAAAQAWIVQKATKYVEFNKVYLKVQRPPGLLPLGTINLLKNKNSVT